MSERIDHAAEAREALKEAGDVRNFATDASASAIAHAMLALTEQQRIANIIALGQLQILSGMDGNGVIVGDGAQFRRLYPDGERTPLAQDIAAALGIGDDDE